MAMESRALFYRWWKLRWNYQRAEFRKKNDAFYNVQRAVRAQKKIQWEEERERREKEKAEWEAKIAAEEAKKIPYEEDDLLNTSIPRGAAKDERRTRLMHYFEENQYF